MPAPNNGRQWSMRSDLYDAGSDALVDVIQSVELAAVRVEHLLHLAPGNAAEYAFDRDTGFRPVTAAVGIVGRRHDVIEIHAVAQLDANGVQHEGRPEVPVEDPARHLRHLLHRAGVPAETTEHVITLLEQRRNPTDVGLDEDDLEPGEPLEDTGEEDIADNVQGLAAGLRPGGALRRKLPMWIAIGVPRSCAIAQKRSSSGLGSRLPFGKDDRMTPL